MAYITNIATFVTGIWMCKAALGRQHYTLQWTSPICGAISGYILRTMDCIANSYSSTSRAVPWDCTFLATRKVLHSKCATHLLSSPFANTGEYRGCPISSLRYDG